MCSQKSKPYHLPCPVSSQFLSLGKDKYKWAPEEGRYFKTWGQLWCQWIPVRPPYCCISLFYQVERSMHVSSQMIPTSHGLNTYLGRWVREILLFQWIPGCTQMVRCLYQTSHACIGPLLVVNVVIISMWASTRTHIYIDAVFEPTPMINLIHNH